MGPAVSVYLAGASSPGLLQAMWRAVRKGSWAIPQLLSVLCKMDVDFSNSAHQILLQEQPSMEERVLAKIAASLLGLSELNEWEPGPNVVSAMKTQALADEDGADQIAKEWLSNLIQLEKL